MKKSISLLLILALMLTALVGCGQNPTPEGSMPLNELLDDTPETYEGTSIVLSDTAITVDGAAISENVDAAVYAANDIVYYESGKDFTYGEGDEKDAPHQG